MTNKDKKFIKRWEKIRSNSKIMYLIFHGIIFGTINFLVLLMPQFILTQYVPSGKFSIFELVMDIVKEYTYYLLIGLILFFIGHLIGAHFTWKRNEDKYNEIIQNDDIDRIIIPQKIKIILNIGAIILIALFIYFNLNYLPFRDTEILKTQVQNYLINEYDVEFAVTDDITRRGATYYVRCYPKIDSDLKFITIWHKGRPEEATDTYINSKLKYPDEAKLKKFIKETYGYDTIIYFEFGLRDTLDDMKYIENQEILDKYKDKLHIGIECHTFVDKLNQKEEIKRAYNIIENYLYDKCGDWILTMHFYSEDYKQDLIKQYKEDNNYFWVMDSTTTTKLHKEGKLLNSLNLVNGTGIEQAIYNYQFK